MGGSPSKEKCNKVFLCDAVKHIREIQQRKPKPMTAHQIIDFLRVYVPFYEFSNKCAMLSVKVYDDPKDPKRNMRPIPEGFKEDLAFTTDEQRVFVNDVTKQVITSYRGSITAEDWLVSDRAIATGSEGKSTRFLQSYELLKLVVEKYKNHSIYATGHSLGGGLAVWVTTRFNRNKPQGAQMVECHAFNPGLGRSAIRSSSNIAKRLIPPTSLAGFYTHLGNGKYFEKCGNGECGTIHLYTTGHDSVSYMSHNLKNVFTVHIMKRTVGNMFSYLPGVHALHAHSMGNFTSVKPGHLNCHEDKLFVEAFKNKYGANKDVCDVKPKGWFGGGGQQKENILSTIKEISSTDKLFWKKPLRGQMLSALKQKPHIARLDNRDALKAGVRLVNTINKHINS